MCWGGATQDRPGPENKVTFSAQQPDCLIILGFGGICGYSQPLSGTHSIRLYLDAITRTEAFFLTFWRPVFVVKMSAGSQEEQRKH